VVLKQGRGVDAVARESRIKCTEFHTAVQGDNKRKDGETLNGDWRRRESRPAGEEMTRGAADQRSPEIKATKTVASAGASLI